MSRRTRSETRRSKRALSGVSLAICGLVAAACGGRVGSISEVPRRPVVAESTTTGPPSSTSTAPGAVDPSTTSVDDPPPVPVVPEPAPDPAIPTAAPEAVPELPAVVDPGAEHTGDGDPMGGPPPETARPEAAWVGFGQPQPGSMFENLQADRSLDGKGKFVALTFDDGPSQYTPQILQILQFLDVRATFFTITKQALANPDLVRLMLASGHRIGSHTHNHPHLGESTPDVQRQEVVGSIDELNATFGTGTVKCFRPPYAQYDQNVLNLVAERQVATAMWSLDTLDWQKPAWQSLVNRVVNGAQDRQVILFHDGGGDRTQTIAALPWIIQGLRDRGFQFLPIC